MIDVIEEGTTSNGMPFRILSNRMGFRLGYVAVGKSHSLFGVDYNSMQDFDVHGGITYAGFHDEKGKGLYWIGFDCAHYGDTQDPSIMGFKYKQLHSNSLLSFWEGTVKDTEFVISECERLSKQLIN